MKPDYEEQQCSFCEEWYPTPVAYYHTEQECTENQRSDQSGMQS